MYLHNNDRDFRLLATSTSAFYGITLDYVVKDYFAVMFLKEVIACNPSLVFKGGTSLSKCYGVINRFSEDVDLGLSVEHATEGMRKNIKRAVVNACQTLGLNICNEGETRSRRDFNRYKVSFTSPLQYGDNLLLVETAVMTPVSPTQQRAIQSFIGLYCEAQGFDDAVAGYGLAEFLLTVSSLEKTFCDKVFAVCDYYLAGETTSRQSRHLYDLEKLQHYIAIDDRLIELFKTVRKQRQGSYHTPSSCESICISETINEIIKSDVYRSDYIKRTMPLLYGVIDYEQALASLRNIGKFLKAYQL